MTPTEFIVGLAVLLLWLALTVVVVRSTWAVITP